MFYVLCVPSEYHIHTVPCGRTPSRVARYCSEKACRGVGQSFSNCLFMYSTAQQQGWAVEHRHTTHGNCSLNVFLQSSKHWLLHCYSSCNIKDIVYWGDQFSLIENCGKCNMKVTTHWKYSTSIGSFTQQANTCTFPSISIRGGERKFQMHGISTNISVNFDWYCLCLPHRIVCTTFPRLL